MLHYICFLVSENKIFMMTIQCRLQPWNRGTVGIMEISTAVGGK